MNILVLAGQLQSGKTSASNFIHGYVLKQLGLVVDFKLNHEGKLLINSPKFDRILDVDRRDFEFAKYATEAFWPHVKSFSFAYRMKEFCINVLGLNREEVYGNNDQKNKPSPIKWSNICSFLPPRTVKKIKDDKKYNEFMTNREVLQYFGTEIIRKLDEDAWVASTYRDIDNDKPNLAVITDCRFENEFYYSRNKDNVKIIKLINKNVKSKHSSETALDKIPEDEFDLILRKHELTLDEKNEILLKNLIEWNFLKGE